MTMSTAKPDRSRIPGGLLLAPLAIISMACVIGCWFATEYVAEGFADQPELGSPLFWIDGHAVYQPFAYFVWLNRWNAYAPHRFDLALFWLYGAVLAGILVAILYNVWRSRGNAVVTTLQSRNSAALVKSVTVTIAPSTHLIQRIEYADREGNRTSFDFSGYHRRAASADTFRFAPPAGVQVIRAD